MLTVVLKAKTVRRFELSDGKSNKFWEVKVDGDSVIALWGKIGSDGRTTTKSFASEAKAKEAVEKMISQKIGKGYTEAWVFGDGSTSWLAFAIL